MTLQECHDALVAIRRRQGTRYPLIRVTSEGRTYQGRLARSDSDPEHRRSPVGGDEVVILGPIGLTRTPEELLPFGPIPVEGIDALVDAGLDVRKAG